MGGISNRTAVRPHCAEGYHPGAELLHRRGPVSEDVVAREHGVFFFEDEAHVVVRVARGVHGADRAAFDGEDLAVEDGLLGFAGCVFVDGGREVRIEAEEVGDTTCMITVPVSKEDVGEGNVKGGERGGHQFGPFGDALAGVDDESFGPSSYDVGVCALECELELL